jgi:hypothetical protein
MAPNSQFVERIYSRGARMANGPRSDTHQSYSHWQIGSARKTASLIFRRPGKGRKRGYGPSPGACSRESHLLWAAESCSTRGPCGIESVCRSHSDPGLPKSGLLELGGVPTVAHGLRRKEEIPTRNAGTARLGAGRLWNTPGILSLAISGGGISTGEDADRARAVLEQHRFIMSFRCFRDVLP